jgi:hypothetical protein
MASSGATSTELSPALANRFSIVVLQDPLAFDEQSFKSDMLAVAAAHCGAASQDLQQLAVDVCWALHKHLSSAPGTRTTGQFTLRSYVRLLDCTALLMVSGEQGSRLTSQSLTSMPGIANASGGWPITSCCTSENCTAQCSLVMRQMPVDAHRAACMQTPLCGLQYVSLPLTAAREQVPLASDDYNQRLV